MTYEQISNLHSKKFRRIVGVKESVFALMVSTVKSAKANARKHPTRGQQPALSIENQVLMTCLFWREYRDQEHIALELGIHQSTVIVVRHEVMTRKSDMKL
jgi:FixJ family two-component response regulator